jgi:hypothetical protein
MSIDSADFQGLKLNKLIENEVFHAPAPAYNTTREQTTCIVVGNESRLEN